MKVGKILIVMILAALGFQVNAQRAVFVHESYNSVRKYIHPLQLSHGQVEDWNRLNRITEIQIRDIETDHRLSRKSKARQIDRVFDKKDRSLKQILSRRQLNKYLNMRVNAGNQIGANYRTGRKNNSGYYDSGRNNRNNGYYNNRNSRNNNSGCPANSGYRNGGSYYNG